MSLSGLILKLISICKKNNLHIKRNQIIIAWSPYIYIYTYIKNVSISGISYLHIKNKDIIFMPICRRSPKSLVASFYHWFPEDNPLYLFMISGSSFIQKCESHIIMP
jgi:hypothetical protein